MIIPQILLPSCFSWEQLLLLLAICDVCRVKEASAEGWPMKYAWRGLPF